MRRIEFLDEKTNVRVLVDLSEEAFQKIKEKYGIRKVNSYIGALGQQAIQNALEKK